MATPKNAPMCIVSIGFQDFLMPVTAGMKVVELMSKAVACESRGYPREIVIGEQPQVGMETVKANQIRQRPTTRDDALTLENRPSPVLRLR